MNHTTAELLVNLARSVNLGLTIGWMDRVAGWIAEARAERGGILKRAIQKGKEAMYCMQFIHNSRRENRQQVRMLSCNAEKQAQVKWEKSSSDC